MMTALVVDVPESMPAKYVSFRIAPLNQPGSLLLSHRHSERLKGVEESLYRGTLAIASGDSSTSFDYAQDRLLCSLGMTYHGEPE